MNSHDYHLILGPCTEYDFDLAELVDGTLTPEREPDVRRHLRDCLRCQRFVQEMSAVDAQLAATLPRPALAADFEARLHARIAGLQRKPAREAALADAQREFESMLGTLRRGVRLDATLNAIAMASVAGGVVAALHAAAPGLVTALGLGHVSFTAAGAIITLVAMAGSFVATRRARAGVLAL
ncbi:MAG TPA: hypothetical protein VF851_09630 [Steroidobacteraceae bacterium]